MVYALHAVFFLLRNESSKLGKFLADKKDKFDLVEQKSLLPSVGFDGFYMASNLKEIN